MKRIILLIVSVIALFSLWFYHKNPLTTKVSIRGQVFYVDVAVTPSERERGLSGRPSMKENEGMLFIYDTPAQYGFWMREMKFPLDFIWLRDKTVVKLDENIPVPSAEGIIPSVIPNVPIDMVLEVNAGTIARLDLQVGDTVKTFQ